MHSRTTLTDSQFITLRDYIYKKTGIFFTEKNRFILETRIREIMEETGHRDLPEYMKTLEDFRTGAAQLSRLFTKITITETSFFRDRYQITAIEKNVIPEIVKTNEPTKSLRIWSAAASSGEEAYTTAILIAEHLKDAVSRWNVSIFASDINDNALKGCRAGVYSAYSLRNTSDAIKEKYFLKLPDGTYSIREETKKMVVPDKCNLMDANACRKYAGIDLLLIRNVLIYFDTVSKTKVLEMCYDNLKNGGYMFLGHSETVFGIANSFKLVNFVNAFAYRKTIDGQPR